LNIVFDLGGVVFDWQPDALIRRVFDDPSTWELVKAEIIEHADWVQLDKGTLALDRAIVRGASRTGLSHEDIARLFNAVPESLTPIQGTIDLIRSISNSNNRLFVLSNMQSESISYLEKNHNIWDLFDGIIISCRINKVKPEIEIYEHLLAEYQLVANETIFIDDLVENLTAASTIGIQTIRFEDPSRCRQHLVDLKCIQPFATPAAPDKEK